MWNQNKEVVVTISLQVADSEDILLFDFKTYLSSSPA